jgi:hypothetical protein
VTISWTTTIPGAAVVRYGNANGPAGSYPNQAAAGSGTSHSATFTASASGTYRYRLVMEDLCGNYQSSGEYTFSK